MSRLCVLAALLIALFPTSTRQKVAIVACALGVGFIANAARIAILAVAVMQGQEARFGFWHVGLGTTLFSVASTAAAGLAWWLLLRQRRPALGTTSSAGLA
jgi:exosortase/archaeosortase family protein